MEEQGAEIGINRPLVLVAANPLRILFYLFVRGFFHCVQALLDLPNRLVHLLFMIDDLDRRIGDIEGAQLQEAQLQEAIDLAKVARLEAEHRVKDLVIAQMQERVALADMVERQNDMPTSFTGILLWKIEDFEQKRRDAISGVQPAIYSPAFYSSQHGYKMCAKIFLNGVGSGQETHISLFFVVMKGEYDSLLPWPFQKKITMMLFDQSSGDHMIDAFRSDPESSSFQRPINHMNIASESPLLTPLDGFNNHGYVVDDTMFIKITVE